MSTVVVDAETERIREAYARRTGESRYSWFNAAHLLAVQERERVLMDLFRRHGIVSLADARVLDVGCGMGTWLRDFVKWGAAPERLTGVDLLPDRIVQARQLCPPGVTLIAGNAADRPWAGRFDIVLQSMVMTSVLAPELRRALAAAMLDAAAGGGVVLWYDYFVNNPRNPDVRGVSRREIASVFPGCTIDLRRVTLAAPLARLVAPRSRALHEMLRAVPLLRTHYLGIIRKA
ncbi:MAG: class I SAM-dependent methyltransferase [Acidobacteria bacterium]|nr:class I SAM-dependent methyltransferase [Acidobacteriota bacterium]